MADPKPFHESLVAELGSLEYNTVALESLVRLTEQSVIPKDHDKIAKAFLEAASRIRPNALYLNNLLAHLNAEKERHETTP